MTKSRIAAYILSSILIIIIIAVGVANINKHTEELKYFEQDSEETYIEINTKSYNNQIVVSNKTNYKLTNITIRIEVSKKINGKLQTFHYNIDINKIAPNEKGLEINVEFFTYDIIGYSATGDIVL